MGPIYTIDDLIDMVRRNARLMLFVIALGAVFSVLFALSKQPVYSSIEVIQIARPIIAKDLASSTVAGSSARRLQLIEQRLMARDSLLEIIEAFNLYAEFPDLRPSELVARLREAVLIEGVAAAREGFADDGTISVLSITAQMPTALQAQQVASEIARRTIALSISTRTETARETLAFFTVQEAVLVDKVNVLEDQIANFRNQNDLTLPGSIEFRRDEIAALNQALLEVDREAILVTREADQVEIRERQATAQRMREGYEAQLLTLAAQRKLLQDRKSALESSLETSPEIERQLGAYGRQLLQARQELETISTQRTEAEVGFLLESERQAERLTVIEPAALADYPVSGGRKRVAILGTMLSAVAAFVLAFILELRNPVIRTAAQLERELGFAPVVSIPYLDPARPKISIWRRLTGWLRSPEPSDGSTA